MKSTNMTNPSHLNKSHRRYNPLMDEWIIVSPNRTNRPWSGQLEKPEVKSPGDQEKHASEASSTANPLSPGATRVNGSLTPNYTSTYTFANDFPALDTSAEKGQSTTDCNTDGSQSDDCLFAWQPAHGRCDVMCFHPDTNTTLALMQPAEVVAVIDEWAQLTKRLAQDNKYRWVQIFENRGAAVGCSNMHPHCQIWTCSFLPTLAARRDVNQRCYWDKHNSNLLLDYVKRELANASDPTNNRIVFSNSDWLVVVPWWACWPFEVMIIPCRRHLRWLHELSTVERASLGEAIQHLLIAYDNLFRTSFPYTMAWLQAPIAPTADCDDQFPHWQLHALYSPPLLRSAEVRKFMSGFEVFAEPQRDLLPEQAAARLREAAGRHYTLGGGAV